MVRIGSGAVWLEHVRIHFNDPVPMRNIVKSQFLPSFCCPRGVLCAEPVVSAEPEARRRRERDRGSGGKGEFAPFPPEARLSLEGMGTFLSRKKGSQRVSGTGDHAATAWHSSSSTHVPHPQAYGLLQATPFGLDCDSGLSPLSLYAAARGSRCTVGSRGPEAGGSWITPPLKLIVSTS